MLANHVYAHLLLLLQPSVLWLSIVTFNNYVKPPGAKVNFARIWCIMNPTPTSLGYLTLKRWHGKIWPQLRALPSVTDRLPTFKGHPTDHVNVIKLKWEIIWTGGLPHLSGLPCLPAPPPSPPPPCKQALKVSPAPFLQFQQLNHSPFIIWVNLVPLESHFYDLISCYYFWTWVLQCQM